MKDYVGLDTAMKLFDCLPFEVGDMRQFREYLQSAHRNGMDVNIHPSVLAAGKDEMTEVLRDGLLMLRASEIDLDLAIVKTSQGQSWLGGNKVRFVVFAGSIDRDELVMGDTFRMLAMALTGINNIYRQRGLLSGSAV